MVARMLRQAEVQQKNLQDLNRPAQSRASMARRIMAQRLQQSLHASTDERFARIVRLGRRLFNVPICQITLVQDEESASPSSLPLLQQAMEHEGVVIVEDVIAEQRQALHPLLQANPTLRFLATAVLHDPEGQPIGALHIGDVVPRSFGAEEVASLRDLAAQVEIDFDTDVLIDTLALQQEGDRQMRAVLDNVAEGILSFDQDGVIVSTNQAGRAAFGYTREELAGKSILDLIASPHDQMLSAPDHDPTAPGIPQPGTHYGLVGHRQHGGRFPIDVTISCVEQSGAVIFLAIVRDNTERAKAERAHLESENYYRSIIANTSDAVFLVDVHSKRLLEANAALCDLLGYRQGEIFGLRLYDISVLSQNRIDRLVRWVGTARMARARESRLRHKDGSLVEVEITLTMITTGGINLLCGVARDIHERKRIQQELRHQRDFALHVMNTMGQGLLITDEQQQITYVNPAFCQLTGRTQDQLIGSNAHDLLQKHDHVADEGDRRWLQAGESLEEEVTIIRSDGTPVDVRTSTVPQRRRGTMVGAITVCTDISADRRIQEALAQARDQAMEASSLKSEFLAIMSHEIRTPMSGILGMTEILLDTPLSDEQREFAEIVRDSSYALLNILNDILDFSKIEAGKLLLEHEAVRLDEVILGTVRLLEPRARQKGLALNTEIAPELQALPLLGDGGRLRQVVLNLVGNALKFTAQGSVTIAGRIEMLREDQAVVYVEVRDTGIGIPEAARSRLFQPFSQADASTTRQFGGTGLGLAICKRLIELMGGEIGVESTVGKGSAFWFRLPLARARQKQ